MVRKATEADVGFLLDKVRDFHEYSPYRDVPLDEEAIKQLIFGLLAGGVIFVSDVGFIAGQITPLFINPKQKIANEIAWWSPEGGGQELREVFEQWAKDNGAHAVQLSILNDERAGRMQQMLTDLDYRPIEVAYIKGLA